MRGGKFISLFSNAETSLEIVAPNYVSRSLEGGDNYSFLIQWGILMSKQDDELYFLTPHSSNPEYPLLVFLPGMDETGKELLHLETKSLEASFDVRCLVIPPNNFMTWEQLTESTIALIRAELERVPQEAVYLCGESLGSCLALKLVECAPHLFKRLILVNSASSFHRVFWLSQSSRLLAWTPLFL